MMKSGFIGIIGRPNVGKSTLLNSILGEKVAITTDKPQTTRNSIRGIYTRFDDEAVTGTDGVQMVFIDTPGIHKARNKLGEAMTEMAVNTYKEVDVVLFLVDGSMKKGPGDKYILDMIRDLDTPKILVINKIDKMEPEEYKEIFDEYEETGVFDAIYGTSALEGKNVPQLLAKIETYLEEGPMFFPEDMVLTYLEEEVPHGVAIEIESYKEEPNITRIGAVIYCERKSHKGIIIGKQGKKLKGIGKSARLEMEALLGTKVFLQLWVKVKENWRDSDFALSNFGYKE